MANSDQPGENGLPVSKADSREHVQTIHHFLSAKDRINETLESINKLSLSIAEALITDYVTIENKESLQDAHEKLLRYINELDHNVHGIKHLAQNIRLEEWSENEKIKEHIHRMMPLLDSNHLMPLGMQQRLNPGYDFSRGRGLSQEQMLIFQNVGYRHPFISFCQSPTTPFLNLRPRPPGCMSDNNVIPLRYKFSTVKNNLRLRSVKHISYDSSSSDIHLSLRTRSNRTEVDPISSNSDEHKFFPHGLKIRNNTTEHGSGSSSNDDCKQSVESCSSRITTATQVHPDLSSRDEHKLSLEKESQEIRDKTQTDACHESSDETEIQKSHDISPVSTKSAYKTELAENSSDYTQNMPTLGESHDEINCEEERTKSTTNLEQQEVGDPSPNKELENSTGNADECNRSIQVPKEKRATENYAEELLPQNKKPEKIIQENSQEFNCVLNTKKYSGRDKSPEISKLRERNHELCMEMMKRINDLKGLRTENKSLKNALESVEMKVDMASEKAKMLQEYLKEAEDGSQHEVEYSSLQASETGSQHTTELQIQQETELELKKILKIKKEKNMKEPAVEKKKKSIVAIKSGRTCTAYNGSRSTLMKRIKDLEKMNQEVKQENNKLKTNVACWEDIAFRTNNLLDQKVIEIQELASHLHARDAEVSTVIKKHNQKWEVEITPVIQRYDQKSANSKKHKMKAVRPVTAPVAPQVYDGRVCHVSPNLSEEYVIMGDELEHLHSNGLKNQINLGRSIQKHSGRHHRSHVDDKNCLCVHCSYGSSK